MALVFPMNRTLADRLLKRMKRGESRTVPHAVASDLRGFRTEGSKCHENVDRWCRENPGDKPVRGWLVTGEYMFTKHSVVDRGPAGLLDITPLSDRTYSDFLTHDGSQEEFDTLPNQVQAVDVWRRRALLRRKVGST
jgi:hypothetical protein